jgi:hypothetical protein
MFKGFCLFNRGLVALLANVGIFGSTLFLTVEPNNISSTPKSSKISIGQIPTTSSVDAFPKISVGEIANAAINVKSNRYGSCYRSDAWWNGWAGSCLSHTQGITYTNLQHIQYNGGSGADVIFYERKNNNRIYSGKCIIGSTRYGQSPVCWNPVRGGEVDITIFPHNNKQTTFYILKPE